MDLTVKDLMVKKTQSEIHALMTAGETPFPLVIVRGGEITYANTTELIGGDTILMNLAYDLQTVPNTLSIGEAIEKVAFTILIPKVGNGD